MEKQKEVREGSDTQGSNTIEYCSNYTCLTRTCGRHRCHHPRRWHSKSHLEVWKRWGPKDIECSYYQGRETLETIINIPESFEVEDIIEEND